MTDAKDSPTPAALREDWTDLAVELKRLHEAATPGDLSTAELPPRDQEDVDCPCCGGEGTVPATDYCNIDGVALGVQFYGIGSEFGAHEKLWRFFVKNIPAILSALAPVGEGEVAEAAKTVAGFLSFEAFVDEEKPSPTFEAMRVIFNDWRSLSTSLARVTGELARANQHIEELQNKIDGDKDCCCSYDEPGVMCSVHSPKLLTAERALETAREALALSEKENRALRGAPDPRAFDLDTWADWLRLIRETQGYMHTCWRQHDGGDRKGRDFAEQALKNMEQRISQALAQIKSTTV
jgi:hypothetical protein